MLTVTFAYTGIMGAFSISIYATCLSFTKQFDYNSHQLVGFVAILNGIGALIGKSSSLLIYLLIKYLHIASYRYPITHHLGGATIGIVDKWMRRFRLYPIILIAFIANCVAFVLIFVNLPFESSYTQTHASGYIRPK
jgi:hypothetical protein